MINNENDILIKEEKSVKHNFLVIKNININIQSYEYKILQEENINNVMKQQLEYEDKNPILKFNIDGFLSLDDYLKYNKLTKKDIKFIIKSIDNILNVLENFLISENSILLDSKSLFISKEEGSTSLYFCIIPNMNKDFSYELSKLLIRLLRYVDINDKGTLALSYELFISSSKENYTINDLLLICKRDDEKNIENSENEICYSTCYDALDDNYYIKDEYIEENQNEDIKEICEETTTEKEKSTDSNNTKENFENGIHIDDDMKQLFESDIFKKDSELLLKEKKPQKNIFSMKANINIRPNKNMIFIIVFLLPPIIYCSILSQNDFYNNLEIVIFYEVLALILCCINKIIDIFYMYFDKKCN